MEVDGVEYNIGGHLVSKDRGVFKLVKQHGIDLEKQAEYHLLDSGIRCSLSHWLNHKALSSSTATANSRVIGFLG